MDKIEAEGSQKRNTDADAKYPLNFTTMKNLQTSVQRLDESLGRSPNVLRMGRTPAKTPKGKLFTFNQSGHDLGLESSGAQNVSSILASRRSSGPALRREIDSAMDVTMAQLEISAADGAINLQEINSLNYAEIDHGIQVASCLFQNFLESFLLHPSKHQIFDLLEKYESACEEAVELLSTIVKKSLPGTNKLKRTSFLLNLLWKESCTWRLIRTLYQDRLQTEAMESDPDAMLMELVGQRLSDKDIVSHLYERDCQVRQNQLVIDWLEKNAALKLDDEYLEKVEYFVSQAVSWENTLHRLQHDQALHGHAITNILVSEMDPDAPIRQKKQLDDLDQEDEIRLLKSVLCYVRAGQLDKAQNLCIKFGQPWRAATLEGWRLYHDVNYDTTSLEVKPVEGNIYRDVWKASCWHLAEEERYHLYERALYASLSGNLRALLPACTSWEDYLWAYFRTMVDVRVEHEIRMNSSSDRKMDSLPPFYWNKNLSPEIIFQELHASQNLSVQNEAIHPFHIVQKYIILNNIDGLMEEMYEWVRDDPAPANHLVRFLAHIVLFLRAIGLSCKEELGNRILEAYVEILIKEKRMQLVAPYTATLPQEKQVLWYAKFLEDVEDNGERQLCLQLAEDACLSVSEITKLVVENIRKRTSDDSTDYMKSTTLLAETTPEDLRKIDAIDWLMFDQLHRAEALHQANALMRTFLAAKKLGAARAVFNKLPPDSITIISKLSEAQTGSTELSPSDSNASREYLCIHTYLQALESFNDWFDHYHHARPELPQLAETASFTERVAYEHFEKQYHMELDRWQHTLRLQTKTTVERLQNVLLFVDGGWMVDQHLEGGEPGRQIQMQHLRELCLPQVAFLLHNVLHLTEQYRSCLQLADLIANEEHKLYLVFHKEELQKFLARLRESSLCLLDQNLDPLGHPIK